MSRGDVQNIIDLGGAEGRTVSAKGGVARHSFGSGHTRAGGASLADLYWLLWSRKIL